VKIYFKFIPHIFGGLFLAVLLVSLFSFALSKEWIRRIIFFPHVNSTKVIGEERFLPDLGNQRENVMLLVDEIVAGPYKYGNLPVIPERTKLKSVILQNGILYVNFSKEIYYIDKLVLITPKEMLQAFTDSVLYNFPEIQKVYIFIEGKPVSDYSELNKVFFYKNLKDFIIEDISKLGECAAKLKNNPILEYCADLKANSHFLNGITFSSEIVE
jgi:hypothetical protein